MRKIFYISVCALMLCILAACDTDTQVTTMNLTTLPTVSDTQASTTQSGNLTYVFTTDPNQKLPEDTTTRFEFDNVSSSNSSNSGADVSTSFKVNFTDPNAQKPNVVTSHIPTSATTTTKASDSSSTSSDENGTSNSNSNSSSSSNSSDTDKNEETTVPTTTKNNVVSVKTELKFEDIVYIEKEKTAVFYVDCNNWKDYFVSNTIMLTLYDDTGAEIGDVSCKIYNETNTIIIDLSDYSPQDPMMVTLSIPENFLKTADGKQHNAEVKLNQVFFEIS